MTRDSRSRASAVPVDRQGNRDPSPGESPGYSEQQPPTAAAARQPGGRAPPNNEEGGVGRNTAAPPNARSPGKRRARDSSARTPGS